MNPFLNSLGERYSEECVRCPNNALCLKLINVYRAVYLDGEHIQELRCPDIKRYPDFYQKELSNWMSINRYSYSHAEGATSVASGE